MIADICTDRQNPCVTLSEHQSLLVPATIEICAGWRWSRNAGASCQEDKIWDGRLSMTKI